ncbi:MAG: hypothetical protein EBR82_22425 [Caulobacteraceae bacterium]|nr:hypothetical protein [Caulobacteraceae bacterium]
MKWTRWLDFDDQGIPTGEYCIGPKGGQPVAVTLTGDEHVSLLTAAPDMLKALDGWGRHG